MPAPQLLYTVTAVVVVGLVAWVVVVLTRADRADAGPPHASADRKGPHPAVGLDGDLGPPTQGGPPRG